MYKLFIKLNKIDNISMCGIYILNLLTAALYNFLFWRDGLLSGSSKVFIAYFSFCYGISIVIDILLIRCVILHRRSTTSMYLHLIYVIVETSLFIVDCIFYGIGLGNLWLDGYLFFVLEAVMIIVYLRRYLILRECQTYEEAGG